MCTIRPVLLLLTLALALTGVRAAEKPSPAFADLSFAAAGTRAATEHKLVFIDFFTTWCGPCKMLDQTTWQNATVIARLREKTVALRIDAEKERDLAHRYHIRAYPTLLLLKPDGTEIDRIVGYHDPAKFLVAFDAALTGKTEDVRAHEAVEQAATPRDKVQARFRLGQQLAMTGKSAEALSEYLWCYDEGMVANPEFAGVRTSFLLHAISILAASYPPAKEALLTRREVALQKAQQPEASRNVLADLVALNRTLNEEGKNLSFYDSLPAGDKRRVALSHPLFQLLLKERRYADIVAGQTYAQSVQTIERYKNLPPGGGTEMEHMNHQFALRSMAEYIEVYVGANDLAHAQELLAGALAFDGSAEARTLYREHLTRAGHTELLPAQP